MGEIFPFEATFPVETTCSSNTPLVSSSSSSSTHIHSTFPGRGSLEASGPTTGGTNLALPPSVCISAADSRSAASSHAEQSAQTQRLPTQDGNEYGVQHARDYKITGFSSTEANFHDLTDAHQAHSCMGMRNSLFEWGQYPRITSPQPQRKQNYLAVGSWPDSHESNQLKVLTPGFSFAESHCGASDSWPATSLIYPCLDALFDSMDGESFSMLGCSSSSFLSDDSLQEDSTSISSISPFSCNRGSLRINKSHQDPTLELQSIPSRPENSSGAQAQNLPGSTSLLSSSNRSAILPETAPIVGSSTSILCAGERLYKCRYDGCNWTSSKRNGDLRRHERVHHGAACKRLFCPESECEYQSRSHSHGKRFEGFKRVDHYQAHWKRKHRTTSSTTAPPPLDEDGKIHRKVFNKLREHRINNVT